MIDDDLWILYILYIVFFFFHIIYDFVLCAAARPDLDRLTKEIS